LTVRLNRAGVAADTVGVNVALAALVLPPALAFGSFLNVVASRVPLRIPIGTSRSRCMSCSHELSALDNIPLVSYAFLRGRCRYCDASIPWRYPAVEAITALLVAACALRFGATAEAVVASAFCIVLVVVAAIDIEHRIVPNRIVLPAAAAVLVAQTVLYPSPEWAIAAVAASGFLLAAALAYPKGMGMGDVKLALLLGAMLGRSVSVAIMAGCLLALVPSAVLFVRHGSRARKIAIPFAPFLACGAVIALFFGDTILGRYLGLFG
jgi:leader peptidase (prepilin peptidase)/N-methyltransferase